MTKPWSKLKSRVEALFVPGLKMAIHANAFRHHTNHDSYDIPRHWIVLDGTIIWDFPYPFIGTHPSPRGRALAYFDEAYWVVDRTAKPIAPAPHHQDRRPTSIIAIILRHYLDRSRECLLDPFPEDEWELVDILRAADSRLGRARLAEWVKTLDDEHPALAVIRRRFPGACGIRPPATPDEGG